MVDRARFEVVMVDSVSGSSRKIVASVTDMDRAFRRLGGSGRAAGAGMSAGTSRSAAGMRGLISGVQRAGRETGRTTSAASKMLTTLGRIGWAAQGLSAVTGAALGVAEAMGRITYSAGAAYLSIASFREDSINALTTVMGGNAQAAGRTFQNALVMANQTPLDPQQVIGMFTSFAVGGFEERELAPLAAAAADISAARGQAASDSLVRVMTQMRGLGRVQRGDITMQAISAGLNAGDIFESIARQMNLGTGRAGIRAAEQAVSRGRVNDRIAIQAFLDSVRRRYDGGRELGTFARNKSNTLTGALSNASGAMFTLLASTDLAATPGVRAFRDAVLAVVGALDMGNPTAQRFRGVIVSLANTVGTGLFGGITTGAVEGALGYVVDIGEGIVGVFRVVLPLGRAFVGGILPGFTTGFGAGAAGLRAFASLRGPADVMVTSFRTAGKVIGFLIGGFGTLAVVGSAAGLVLTTVFAGIVGAPARLIETIDELGTSLGDWALGSGTAIVDGFILGLEGGAARIHTAVRSTFEGAVSTARSVLDWHSPSGVFRDAGVSVAQGFELGVSGGAGGARDAVAQLVTPQGLAIGGGAAGGGNVIHVGGIAITVEGRGRGDRELADDVTRKVLDLFEMLRGMGPVDPAPAGATG